MSRSASKLGTRISALEAWGTVPDAALFEGFAASAEEEDELEEELETGRLGTDELELDELVEVELRFRRTFRRRFAMAVAARLQLKS